LLDRPFTAGEAAGVFLAARFSVLFLAQSSTATSNWLSLM